MPTQQSIAFLSKLDYNDGTIIIIRFPNPDVECKALGYLTGRFSFKSWETGETAVPPQALASLATEGITFTVEGPARYEQLTAPVRNPFAKAV